MSEKWDVWWVLKVVPRVFSQNRDMPLDLEDPVLKKFRDPLGFGDVCLECEEFFFDLLMEHFIGKFVGTKAFLCHALLFVFWRVQHRRS